MEEIDCIFCKDADSKVFIQENGYDGRKCSKCGLIYISPRPTSSEITQVYTHNQSNISADEHIQAAKTASKCLDTMHNLKIIRKFRKQGSLLEIGCGAGLFLSEAQKSGFQVFGIELNPQQVDFVRTKMEIPCDSLPLHDNSFGTRIFDIIYHCNVMSHFYNPFSEFKQLHAKLSDNGIVVFQTGNYGDVEDRYFEIIKNTERFQYPDHLYFFSENNLLTVLKETGFNCLKIFRYSRMPEKYVQLYCKKKSLPFALTFDQIRHFLTYKLGAIYPRKGRPQTLIIIAQKS